MRQLGLLIVRGEFLVEGLKFVGCTSGWPSSLSVGWQAGLYLRESGGG